MFDREPSTRRGKRPARAGIHPCERYFVLVGGEKAVVRERQYLVLPIGCAVENGNERRVKLSNDVRIVGSENFVDQARGLEEPKRGSRGQCLLVGSARRRDAPRNTTGADGPDERRQHFFRGVETPAHKIEPW